MKIVCPQCKKEVEKATGAVNRARSIGAPVYCGRVCSGLAMQGICASQAGDKYHVNDGWLHPETVAKAAIEMADELLKQLEQW